MPHLLVDIADMHRGFVMNTGEKNRYIRNTRVLCMLWIVGFWHLGGVSNFEYSNHNTLLFTKGILATFVFISGYLYAGRQINDKKEMLTFYKKKFIRIYPLFIISIICFYLLYLWDKHFWYITSIRQCILSILGIACIFPPAPGTVWFIEMMLLFWGITPIILQISGNVQKVIWAFALCGGGVFSCSCVRKR